MQFIRKNRIIFFVPIFIFLYFITRQYVIVPIYVTYHNRFKSSQDNVNLVRLIKNHFLIPPVLKDVKLSLKNEVWSSPAPKVVPKILKNKTGGFFIERGAYNGNLLSNSIELERYFGWEGLLIEADPTYQAELITKNRKAWIAPVCLSTEPYPLKITMQRPKEWAAMSNIASWFFGKMESGNSSIKFEVQCFPLYSILLALNRTEIDYLSLDFKGAELSVFKNIPFDLLKIKVISLEASKDYPQIANYLQRFGYQFYSNVRNPYIFDHLYVHESLNLSQFI